MLHYKTYHHKDIEKPWVTFVHGAGGSSSIWFSQIRSFKKEFNLLLVDLRGHGKSTSFKSENNYSFSSISDEVVEVLDFLEIKQTHFIGISLGTIIIMDIAHRYSAKVSSLVMGGAVMYLNFRAQFLMRVGVGLKRVVPYLWLYKLFAFIIMPKKNHTPSRLFFINEAKKMNQKEFIKWFSLVSSVNKLLSFFRKTKIETPVLYIMGAQDYMFLPSVKKIVASHTNSVIELLKDCGHVVNIEASALFNTAVISYLKQRNPTLSK
ncbi:alpha/beta fold hydrolase [Wenyingzhuangia aestuarii]|uniref:alpha/beta fold hydrolase n=1 Tax=Wenyingzhuangia aestuarii TaxID=1647582 RepID=UPI00143BD121|nr:alpha/beta hydrolase [Wenyingzhuangia aestuarii]NJB82275.1 pimeloyl-ACP methyl ester carboxylesterase [Wenyingzhuangia aestuarii]